MIKYIISLFYRKGQNETLIENMKKHDKISMQKMQQNKRLNKSHD